VLEQVAKDTAAAVYRAIDHPVQELHPQEIGKVTRVSGGIAHVKGLPGVTLDELVEFPSGVLGIAIDLGPDEVGVMLMEDTDQITAGIDVARTSRTADTPVGEELLGRVVDATGRALDYGKELGALARWPIERAAPAIIERAPVATPLETGIKAIDALIPIGRGQRELIVGDRQTGKTAVAVDAIINQHDKNVICIYCAIGQRGTAVARVIDTLRRHDALKYTIVVVASDEAAPGLRFVTPYAATSMAEYFTEQGMDTLIVFDDLTRHARAYREISLLLRRPPGREAYPGDIFYIHSRLLERATHLHPNRGNGSLTALPIVETQAQDLSAYIPTNLISITDGQIYLSPTLFNKGILPAIDLGKSVSRVGGTAQYPAFRHVAGTLRLSYAQFEELETFARFSARLDEATKQTIERGRRVREVLQQTEHKLLPAAAQIAVLVAVNAGILDAIELPNMNIAQDMIQAHILAHLPELCTRIEAGENLSAANWQQLRDAATDAVQELAPNLGE
jgi:F-type H+-transporting ATPase subunit alpha